MDSQRFFLQSEGTAEGKDPRSEKEKQNIHNN